jgi:hypothetical protein
VESEKRCIFNKNISSGCCLSGSFSSFILLKIPLKLELTGKFMLMQSKNTVILRATESIILAKSDSITESLK